MANHPRQYKETKELNCFIDEELKNNNFAAYEDVDAAVQTAFGKHLPKPVYNQRLLCLRRKKKQEQNILA